MRSTASPSTRSFKFQEITKGSGGKPIEIEFRRNGQMQTVTVKPVFAKLDGPQRWMIGVMPEQKLNLITTRLSLPAAFANRCTRTARAPC